MRLFLLFFTFLFGSNLVISNDLQISNAVLDYNPSLSSDAYIKFDLSWKNSWKTNSYEKNYDAVWIFAKYKTQNSTDWRHIKLMNSGHLNPTNGNAIIETGLSNISIGHNPISNPVVGAFIYKQDYGVGNNNFTNIKLKIDYQTDLIADPRTLEICVYGIEMVYIPNGAFNIGDGTSAGTLSSSATMNMINDENATSSISGLSVPATALPTTFPKGTRHFYTMKYELTQGMYVEFLNKLTRAQQASRTPALATGQYMSTIGASTPTNRNGIKCLSDPGAPNPRIYTNDLNNGTDGKSLACNYLTFQDVLAFADWSGLRPLSELEYEKMSRGTQTAVSGEYVWGNNSNYNAISSQPSSSGTANEVPNSINENVNAGNIVQGPMRVGAFARSGTNRIQAGASYYGILDLAGNLNEYYYTISSSSPSTIYNSYNFKYFIHGNGELDYSIGNTDISNNEWPISTSSSAAYYNVIAKGGHYATTTPAECAISFRSTSNMQNVNIQTRTTSAINLSQVGARLGRSGI